jgi:hypothetical protein
MAKVYAAPKGFEAPDIGYVTRPDWREFEQAYIDRMAEAARAQPGAGPLVGQVLRIPYADGAAQYLVWSEKPLELIWLELGDAWSVPDYQTRGLRLADVAAMIGRRRPSAGA